MVHSWSLQLRSVLSLFLGVVPRVRSSFPMPRRAQNGVPTVRRNGTRYKVLPPLISINRASRVFQQPWRNTPPLPPSKESYTYRLSYLKPHLHSTWLFLQVGVLSPFRGCPYNKRLTMPGLYSTSSLHPHRWRLQASATNSPASADALSRDSPFRHHSGLYVLDSHFCIPTATPSSCRTGVLSDLRALLRGSSTYFA